MSASADVRGQRDTLDMPATCAHCGDAITQGDGEAWAHQNGEASCQGGEERGEAATPTPACSRCGIALMARVNPTPEQAWCGKWFDHPPVPFGACGNQRGSALLPSTDLLKQNEELRQKSAAGELA